MTRPPIYNYQMGAGYNLPLGSLTNIETIVPTGERAIYPPQSFGNYLPGAPEVVLDGTEINRGYESTVWNWTGQGGNGYLTYAGAGTLRDLFVGGGWSGPVTVYTPTQDAHTYERYNAIATFTKYPESGANFKIFTKYSIKLTRLSLLA